MTNLEVSVALLLLEDYFYASSLRDGGLEACDEQQAAELLRSVREAVARLKSMGYDETEILRQETQPPEHIRIGRDYRITLPSRGGEELLLPPLMKTVFILFLKHPEGLSFKQLSDCEEELLQIYEAVAPEVDTGVRKGRIERLVAPIDGTIYMVRSKLSRAIEKYFPGPSSKAYEIIGKSGQKKVISLDRTLVEWE